MVINLNYGENAMQYGMYQEIMDQPISLRLTIDSEKEHIEKISEDFRKLDKIFLINNGAVFIEKTAPLLAFDEHKLYRT